MALLLAGCGVVPIGCTRAQVEPSPATYDPATETLTFEVRISSRRGPVVGGPVEMSMRYQGRGGEGPVNSVYMTTGDTDAEGVATGTVTLDRLIRNGQASGHLTGEWLAAFHTERAVDGTRYCWSSEVSTVPDEVVSQVNAAVDDFMRRAYP